MYKKKEFILIIIIIFIIIYGYFFISKPSNETPIITENNETIIINLDGEIARKTRLEYQNSITYGALFLNIKYLLNEYSDLSSFNLQEVISFSIEIFIPTLDVGNDFQIQSFKININSATKSELKSLPQIGDKRSQTILDYINRNGPIKTWEEFFSIVSVKDEYKETIKKQAILQ